MIALGCAFIVLIVLAVSAGMAGLTMVALGAVGVHVSFWVAWAIYIVLSAIFRGATK
jgi:hypothetical protein